MKIGIYFNMTSSVSFRLRLKYNEQKRKIRISTELNRNKMETNKHNITGPQRARSIYHRIDHHFGNFRYNNRLKTRLFSRFVSEREKCRQFILHLFKINFYWTLFPPSLSVDIYFFHNVRMMYCNVFSASLACKWNFCWMELGFGDRKAFRTIVYCTAVIDIYSGIDHVLC